MRRSVPWGRPVLGFVCLLVVLCSPVVGQFDSGQISGFVRDQSGGFIPGANVTVTNEATGQARAAITEDNGYYVLTNLGVGYFTVTVEMAGFKKFSQTRVKVDANSKVSVDASLELGEIDQVITVEASTAQLQRNTAQVGKIVEARDIQDLALNGRNPIFLALLKPGVRGGTFNNFSPDSLTSGGFSINGGRSDENLITVDGTISTRTRASGAIIGTLNVDTVQEVQVLTANYSAEYGRSSGGQIRFITKSGSQEFHGDFYEFFRNSALDANSWSRNRVSNPETSRRPAPFRFNQFGYDIGGPVYIPGKFNTEKNKLFFFWAQEWIRFRREQTNFGTVPSLKMRQGDFSELLDPTNRFFGRKREIVDVQTGQPFANNVIPANRLSPNGLALLRAYPEPIPGFIGPGANNWFGNNPNPRDTRKDTLKIDFHPTNDHQVSFRGSLFSWEAIDPFRGTFDRARTDWSRPNRSAALSWTWTMSPTLINEFTFAPSADLVFIRVFQGAPFQRSKYGINYPYIFPGIKEIEDKIPTINISGFSTVDGGPYPAFSSGPIYTFSDNMTWIKDTHTFKWGVFVEYSGQNDFDQINVSSTVPGATNNQNGRFVFEDNRAGGAGLAVANAALGLFNSYGEIGKRAYTPWRATAFDLFFQDSWKVRPELSFEYGVRYAYWPPWKSQWGNIAMFHPAFFDPSKSAVVDPKGGFIVSGDRFNGIVLPGSTWPDKAREHGVEAASNPAYDRLFRGLPEGFSKTHKNVFQPRLGLAYSFDRKTVLRLGVGMFHNRVTLNDSTLLGGNAPIQFMVGVTDGLADAPAGAGSTRRDFPFLLTAQDPKFKHPTAWNWNLTVQREIFGETTVELAYVGRRGYNLVRERNINQLLQAGDLQRGKDQGITNADALRPFRGIGIIRLSENAAHSWYHGMQASVDRRFTRNLGFGMAYTFSKITSNADDKRNVLTNAYNDRNWKGLSDLDRTHVFNVHYIYELPFLRNNTATLGKVLGGWQVSGVTFFQSGAPLNVWNSEDVAGIGPGSGNQFWNVNGNPILPKSDRKFSNSNADQNFWFNPTVFSKPAAGTWGNAGRNILRGPGFQTWDIAVFKNFRLTEDARIQFRAELFNFPNHPNWNNPVVDPKSSSFGRVVSKDSERNLQFGLKISF